MVKLLTLPVCMSSSSCPSSRMIPNELTQAPAFEMNEPMARAIVEEVARQVEGGKEPFQSVGVGVGERDIDVLTQYLDGDRLGSQRRNRRPQ